MITLAQNGPAGGIFCLVDPEGVEPSFLLSESRVLPLDDRSTGIGCGLEYGFIHSTSPEPDLMSQ